MRTSIIALAIACVALTSCSGGGGSTGAVPQAGSSSNNAGGSSGSSTSSAGKATVTITFAVPPKGSAQSTSRSTAATTGRSPQWVSPNTTTVWAYFFPSGSGTYASNSAPCTTSCTLSVNVAPGNYNVLVTAGDSNGPLSAGTATGFTVTLGAANTLTLSGPLTEVLKSVQFAQAPTFPATVYNGQTTASTVTVNLLDYDGNVVSQPPPYVDYDGNPITGLHVTPSSSNSTLTINGGTTAVPITATGQTLNVSFNGTETLGSTVSFASYVSTGTVTPASVSAEVYSPFHVAQVTPPAYNPLTGANTGDPEITSQDFEGQSSIEYPFFGISQAQTLTLTDQNGLANAPISVDPSGCTNSSVISSVVAGGTPYDGYDPIVISSLPATISYTVQAPNQDSCTINIYDDAATANDYYMNLYFDENLLYVSGTKRGKAK